MNDQMLADDREALIAALAEETTDAGAEAERRSQLMQRRQELAPEALAGDEDVLAELEEVNTALATLDYKQELRQLAEREHAARERAAAEAERVEVVASWRAEQEQAEAERDQALAKFERALSSALEAAAVAIQANEVAASLHSSIAPGSGYRRLHREIEARLIRRIHDELGRFGIKPDMLVGREGAEPLVAAEHDCIVCRHRQLAEIEERRDAGASLRALEEDFSVSRSALSSHFRGHE